MPPLTGFCNLEHDWSQDGHLASECDPSRVTARHIQSVVEETLAKQHEQTRQCFCDLLEPLHQSVRRVENIPQACAEIVESCREQTLNDHSVELLMQSVAEQLAQHQRSTETLLRGLLDTARLSSMRQGASMERIAEGLAATMAKRMDTMLSEHFEKEASRRYQDVAASSDRLADHLVARLTKLIVGKRVGDDAAQRGDSAAANDSADVIRSRAQLPPPPGPADGNVLSPEQNALSSYVPETSLADTTCVDSDLPMPYTAPWLEVQRVWHEKTSIHHLVAAVGWSKQFEKDPPTYRSHLVPSRWQQILNGPFVTILVMVAIIMNSILIGIQADNSVKREITNYESRINNQPDRGLAEPTWIMWIDVFFTVLFSVELICRIAVEEIGFFNGAEWKWNLLDVALVLSALIEQVFEAYKNLSFFRLFRILRAFRAVRLIRVMRYLRELRVMVISVMNSVQSLFWALIFLFSIKFLFAVFIIQGVADYMQKNDPDEPDLDVFGEKIPDQLISNFGSIDGTLMTLFACVSGGFDWYVVYWPLHHMAIGYGLLFVTYISFMLVGVLNVIIGLFVDGANKSSQQERESLDQGELQVTGAYLSALKETLLASAEGAEDGFVTEPELEACLSSSEVVSWFEDHNIDRTEVVGMLKLIGHESHDGCRRICVDEFIVGLLLLKDDTSKDMITFWYEHKELQRKLYQFVHFTHEHFAYQERVLERQSSLLEAKCGEASVLSSPKPEG